MEGNAIRGMGAGNTAQVREQTIFENQIARFRQTRQRIDDELSRFGTALDRLLVPTPAPARDGSTGAKHPGQPSFEWQLGDELSELEYSLERLALLVGKLDRAI